MVTCASVSLYATDGRFVLAKTHLPKPSSQLLLTEMAHSSDDQASRISFGLCPIRSTWVRECHDLEVVGTCVSVASPASTVDFDELIDLAMRVQFFAHTITSAFA